MTDLMNDYDRNMGRDPSPPDYKEMQAGDMLTSLGDNGAKWADAFCQINPDADWGLMLGWFCNAIEHSNDVRRWAREALASNPPAEAGDWVLVPREPTEAMYVAGWKRANDVAPNAMGIITDTACADIYRAMLAAAPTRTGVRTAVQVGHDFMRSEGFSGGFDCDGLVRAISAAPTRTQPEEGSDAQHDAIRAAYLAGAVAVAEYFGHPTDDLGEGADDYAASVLAPPTAGGKEGV